MRTDPNLEALRNISLKADPHTGDINAGALTDCLYKALKSIVADVSNIGSQTNSALGGTQTEPPPAVDQLIVNASGGVAHLQAVHNVPIYRGIEYHYHVSADGGSTWSTLYSGPNRDVRIPVGSASLHYAVTCDYPTSPSSPVTHYTGGTTKSKAVTAIGTEPPPMPSSQGSGTGTPGQMAGYGPVAWRGATPPRRF